MGSALALTVAIMYSVCTGAWVIWHEGALDLLNALFHGPDFRKIQVTEAAFTFSMFIFPLLVMTAWGFVTGSLYAVAYNLIQRFKKAN